MSTLSDQKFEELKGRLNNAIHEIVFACQLLEDNQIDEAVTCLVTAQGTIDGVAEEMVAIGKEGGR